MPPDVLAFITFCFNFRFVIIKSIVMLAEYSNESNGTQTLIRFISLLFEEFPNCMVYLSSMMTQLLMCR